MLTYRSCGSSAIARSIAAPTSWGATWRRSGGRCVVIRISSAAGSSAHGISHGAPAFTTTTVRGLASHTARTNSS